MNTKEKLEMIWKYLALILIAILGFTWIENNHFIGGPKKGEFVFIGDENYDFHGNELKKMNGEMKWISEDGEIHIMKMRYDDEYELHEEDENGNKKISRKKIMKKNISN